MGRHARPAQSATQLEMWAQSALPTAHVSPARCLLRLACSSATVLLAETVYHAADHATTDTTLPHALTQLDPAGLIVCTCSLRRWLR
jgi:hypothetical protein